MGRVTSVISSGQEFLKGAKYVGSKECQPCHAKQYDEWQKTWHSKMIRVASPEVVVGDFNNVTYEFKNIKPNTLDGKPGKPITVTVRLFTKDNKYFFTLVDKDNEANSQTYEISYVIGGNWDQHYEVTVGDQHFPAPVRWSVADRSWLSDGFRPVDWFADDGTADGIPLKPDKLAKLRSSESKCSGCHETGYKPVFDKERKVWTGTSVELGISCERCHGPGSKHVEAKGAPGTIVQGVKDLTTTQQRQLCAQCHGRATNKVDTDLAFQVGFIPGDIDMGARVSFWSYNDIDPQKNSLFWPTDWANRNRQQWQDFTKSKHFWKTDMTCLTCHTFHGEFTGRQMRMATPCVNCHNTKGAAARPNYEFFNGSPMAQAGVNCVDCHMPKVAWRTDPTFAKPETHWDTTSHTFLVSKPQYAIEYGQRSSCDQCHTPGGRSALKMDSGQQNDILRSRQSQVRIRLSELAARLAEARQRASTLSSPEARARVDDAAARIDMVIEDGSAGFHNFSKATSLLNEADELLAPVLRP